MSQQLISRSPDLKRLRDEGYEIEKNGGYLLIHHIPYVNQTKEIKYGSLVSELTLINNERTEPPRNHVIGFIGEYPCNKDGDPINQIRNVSRDENLGEGIIINHRFSNKPRNGYKDYYHKVTNYVNIISSPAKSIDNTVTEKTYRVITDVDDDSVFQYLDTNSSRANIGLINSKFYDQKIAIIGLGGTGAYILDLVAKTPVKEIHLLDGDSFLQHNAFRSPGAISDEDLRKGKKKVVHYKDIYSNIHKNIIVHDFYIDEESLYHLDSMSYVFLCIDKNGIRKKIINHLLNREVPFIDVGMGVNVVDDSLIGTLRVTVGTKVKNDHIHFRVPEGDFLDNDYSTNIQIADLNSLNATLAVIKWKKMSGFYQDLEKESHCTYSINVAQLQNEDKEDTL